MRKYCGGVTLGSLDVRGHRGPIGGLPRAITNRPPSAAPGAFYSPPAEPGRNAVVLSRRLRAGPRDLAAVARYHETDLPLDDLLVISDDTSLVFGWLASRAFWVWRQAARSGRRRATTLQAYNSFPVPTLSRSDRALLDEAAENVLLARSYLMEGSLEALYANPPVQLVEAHRELDAVVDRLMDIPAGADDKVALSVLVGAYEALAA